MSSDTKNKFGEVLSFGLDFVPGVGTAKGVYEGFTGKDSVTGEELNGFDRAMCFVGAIPLVGNMAKGVTKSKKAVKAISVTSKCAKWADRAYTIKNGKDLFDNDDDNK